MAIKIATANLYVLNPTVRMGLGRLYDFNVDSIGFQEAHTHLPEIKEVLNQHLLLRDQDVDTMYAKEVAVALNERNYYAQHQARIVSPCSPAEETRVFKERWITIVRFHCEGQKIVHINHHANASLQNDKGDLMNGELRVQRYVEGMKIIDERIKYWKDSGWRIVVTGDFNYRRFNLPGFEPDYWSPQRMFSRNNLDFEERGLDYVAWDARFMHKNTSVLQEQETGSDHPWIIVTLG